MEEKHLIVGGLHVMYIDCGVGPLTLFLHGWGQGASSFEPLVEHFENNRCLYLSLPGFGGSESPPIPWGVSEYARFVRLFLDKLNIGVPDVIIAHSFGGRVAIKGLDQGILETKSLVLIASAGASKSSMRTRAFKMLAQMARVFSFIPFMAFFRRRARLTVGSRDYLSAGRMRDTFVKVIGECLENSAGRIKTPTLLIWGGRDKVTPLTEARILHGLIRDSKLNVIPGAGHFVFQEQPRLVAQIVKEFLCF